MKRNRLTSALALAALLTATTPTLFSQSPADGSQSNSYLWTGKVIDQGGVPVMVESTPSMDDINAAIAEASHIWQVSRDAEQAAIALNKAWLVAHHVDITDSAQRQKMVAKALLARAEHQNRLGATEMAIEVLSNANLVLPTTYGNQNVVCLQASQEIQNELHAALNDPLVIALRNGFQQDIAKRKGGRIHGILPTDRENYLDKKFGLPVPEVFNFVKRSLSTGDSAAIRELGVRASSSLAHFVLIDLEEENSFFVIDPLTLLVQVDAPRAAQLIMDWFERGDQGWRMRISEAFAEFPDPRWGYALNTRNAQCGPDYLPDLLGALYSHPDTSNHFQTQVKNLIRESGYSKVIDTHLQKLLSSNSTSAATAAIEMLDAKCLALEFLPTLTLALHHSHPGIRRQASRIILESQFDTTCLRKFAGVEDVEIRANVARSLQARTMGLYETHGSGTHRIYPGPSEVGRKILIKLLNDESKVVRSEAIDALFSLNWEFGNPKPYLTVLENGNAQQLATLARFGGEGETIQRKVHIAMAKSTRPDVLAAFDHTVVKTRFHEHFIFSMDAIGERLKNSILKFGQKVPLESYPGGNTPDGLWLLKQLSEIREFRSDSIRLAVQSGFTKHFDYLESTGVIYDSLDSDAALLVLKHAPSNSHNLIKWAIPPIRRADGVHEEELVKITQDVERPLKARLAALSILILEGAKEAEQAAYQIAQSMNAKPTSWDLGFLQSVRFPNPDRQQAFLLELAPYFAQAPAFVTQLYREFDRTHNPAQFLPILLHPKWNAEENVLGLYSVAGHVLNDLPSIAPHVDHIDYLLRNNVPPAQFIEGLQRHREPKLLMAFSHVVCDTEAHESARLAAVSALMAYQSTAAGKELTNCLAQVSHEGVVYAIREALSTMKEQREAMQYWETADGGLPNEGAAIKELLEMLKDEDPEIRAAAIQSLVPFRKPELLPRIIPLLKDESVEVRDAAKSAIRKLQEMEPETSEG